MLPLIGIRGRELSGKAETAWEWTEERRKKEGPKLWEDTGKGVWEGEKGCAYSKA